MMHPKKFLTVMLCALFYPYYDCLLFFFLLYARLHHDGRAAEHTNPKSKLKKKTNK